jgi:hypothetical protein
LLAFCGAGGAWYSIGGAKGALGTPSGVGENYNDLGKVGRITYDDLKSLGELGRFRKGVALDKRLVAVLVAVTAEAARFATVATYFTGLTNSVGTELAPYLRHVVIDFDSLLKTYFNNWANPPGAAMEAGKVYHFSKNDILMPKKR